MFSSGLLRAIGVNKASEPTARNITYPDRNCQALWTRIRSFPAKAQRR